MAFCLIVAQDVNGEVLCVGKRFQAQRAQSDGPENQRRVERDRCDGVRREPVRRTIRVTRRENRDAGGEPPHDLPKLLAVDHGVPE